MKAPLIRLSLVFALAGSVFALMLGMHTLLILLCIGEIILLLASGAFDDREDRWLPVIALVGLFLLVGLAAADLARSSKGDCHTIASQSAHAARGERCPVPRI